MALWTPADAPSVFSWLDFSDAASLTLSGTSVTSIGDQIGGGPGAYQTDSAQQPDYNSLTGCVEFRGGASSATTGTRLDYGQGSADPQTIKAFFAVFKALIATGSTNGHAVLGANGTGTVDAAMNIRGTPDTVSLDGSGTVYGKAALNGGATVGDFTTEENPAAGEFNEDGDLVYGCWGTAQSILKIGAGRSTGQYRMNADIVHLVALDAEPDQDLIDKLMGWGAWDAGLEAKLPGGHPYASAPPTTGADVVPLAGEQTQSAETVAIGIAGAVTISNGEQAQGAETCTLDVAPIEIVEPTDRGRVDLGSSAVIEDSGNIIVDLFARASTDYESGSTSGDTRAQVVYAQVSGVQGIANLRFRVNPPASGSPTGWYANDRIMYRQTGSGPEGWTYFETSSGGSAAAKLGYNSTAFAFDDIDIGFNLPLPLGEVDAWLSTLIASGYAVEPASSVGGGGYYYAELDESLFIDDRTGAAITNGTVLRQRCIELRDPAAVVPAGRTKALVGHASGVHASEDAGTLALYWHVKEWLENAEYRKRADLLIYPTLGPSGRYVGRRRGTSQTAAIAGKTNGSRGSVTDGEDLNREFPDSSGNQWSIENTNTRAAWSADDLIARLIATNGAFVDWHTDGVGGDPAIFVYTGESGTDDDREAAWVAASDAYITGTVTQSYTSVDTTNTYMRNNGVTFAATVEFGYDTADLIAWVEEVGRGFALGLIDAFDAGVVGGYAVAIDHGEQVQSTETVDIGISVTVAVSPATLALTGQDVTVRTDTVIAVAPATLALSGQAVDVIAATTVGVAPGVLTLAGQDVAATSGTVVSVTPAVLALTGAEVGVSAASIVAVAPATLLLTGQAIGVSGAQLVAVGPAVLSLVGENLNIIAATVVAVGPATLAVTGQDIGAVSGTVVAVVPGGLAFAGQDIGVAGAAIVSVAPGTLALQGQAIGVLTSDLPPPPTRYHLQLRRRSWQLNIAA